MNNKDTFVIQGLAGEKTINGSISISGAKNSALKAMTAAILFDGPVILENVPETSDIHTLANIMIKMGARIEFDNDNIAIDSTDMNSTVIDESLAKGMRGSVVLTGPILARYKKASFPAPGGCVIGARPIDLFLSGYEKMGAKVNEHDSIYDISTDQELEGSEIIFNKISVGATETLMMAAVLANGTTVMKNCALEPEIVNLAEWLNASGANISGVGTPVITVVGTGGRLLSMKENFVTIPDRITAGSFLILGALCAIELTINDCRPDHMDAVTQLLIESGVNLKIGKDYITVSSGLEKTNSYKAIPMIRTREYPGFPTDLQAPMVTFLTQCSGRSTVIETIFEGRFKYIEELTKIGANIKVISPLEIVVQGPTLLNQNSKFEQLTTHDIRAGFAVVLAAVIGKGKFVINNINLIDRGYESLDKILANLGVDIERVSNS